MFLSSTTDIFAKISGKLIFKMSNHPGHLSCRKKYVAILFQIPTMMSEPNMKTTISTVIFFMAAASLFADGTNVFTDEKSRASYAIGMMLGHNWKQQGVVTDPDWVSRGLKDAQSGGATLLTLEQMQETLRQFQQALQAEVA